MTPDQEQVGWLRCLISSYRNEHDWEADEDPTATAEMIVECEHLAARLAAAIPEEPTHEPVAVDTSEVPF